MTTLPKAKSLSQALIMRHRILMSWLLMLKPHYLSSAALRSSSMLSSLSRTNTNKLLWGPGVWTQMCRTIRRPLILGGRVYLTTRTEAALLGAQSPQFLMMNCWLFSSLIERPLSRALRAASKNVTRRERTNFKLFAPSLRTQSSRNTKQERTLLSKIRSTWRHRNISKLLNHSASLSNKPSCSKCLTSKHAAQSSAITRPRLVTMWRVVASLRMCSRLRLKSGLPLSIPTDQSWLFKRGVGKSRKKLALSREKPGRGSVTTRCQLRESQSTFKSKSTPSLRKRRLTLNLRPSKSCRASMRGLSQSPAISYSMRTIMPASAPLPRLKLC